jgi:beta-phosphoglucomutase
MSLDRPPPLAQRLALARAPNVVVLRALAGLGDLLNAVPALRALRAGLPDAHVTLLGLPSALPFVDRFGAYLDDLLPFPGFPGIPERRVDPARLASFLADVQGRFDLALQLQGNGTFTTPFTLLLGATHTAGFCRPDLYCPDPAWFVPYIEHGPERRRLLGLLSFLGLGAGSEALEFPLRRDDRRELRQAWPEWPGVGAYVCVHAGASEPARRWPPERFAAVADVLADLGHRVVLTGTVGEAPTIGDVRRRMHAEAVDLTGRTSLGALAALVDGARLVVTNDTGVSHLADALATPSVVVFVASDPERWGPVDRDRHRVVGAGAPSVADAPPVADVPSVADVLVEVHDLLGTPRAALRGPGTGAETPEQRAERASTGAKRPGPATHVAPPVPSSNGSERSLNGSERSLIGSERTLAGLIFDVDGVLADTVELHFHSWRRLADDLGWPFTREANEALRGRSRGDALDLFLDGRRTETPTADLLEQKNRYFLEALAELSPADVAPGVLALLDAARARGLRVGVASGSRNARRVCERLGLLDRFDAFADGATVARGKPHPDLFVWVAGALGLAPPACVVIEDAEAGVEAALAGGFRVVGVGPVARVGKADHVVADLTTLSLDDLTPPERRAVAIP